MLTPEGARAPAPVLGRYRLGPVIGRGATAVVRRARDLATGEEVAVKAVPVELGLAPRVRAEVRAAGRLEHPGIVPLIDWGEDRDHLYLVWELVEGDSLAGVLRAGRIGDAAALRLAVEVLGALAHAHARGVVHRDVKPANILIGEDGHARLSDFGVARLSGEAGLTMTGGVVGTVAYMAPEQARGEPVGAPADVYATCLVLYEALAGSNPLWSANPAETARRAAAAAVPPLGSVRPDLPRAVLRAVDAGLARAPEDRPGAGELGQVLRDGRAGLDARRPPRRVVAALPAVASGLAGAALGALLLDRGTDLAAQPRAALVALAGAAAAWRPRLAALVLVIATAALVARTAPAAGALLGAAGLVALALGWPAGRATLLPAAAPVLFALGLGALYAGLAGLPRNWPARLSAAVTGVAATLAWQVAAGGDGLLFEPGATGSAVRDLEGSASPLAAVERFAEPLLAHPALAAQALAVVAAALCVPLVRRARPGGPRLAATAVWLGALAAGAAALSADPATVLAGTVPAGVIALACALAPWQVLPATALRTRSATLRTPA